MQRKQWKLMQFAAEVFCFERAYGRKSAGPFWRLAFSNLTEVPFILSKYYQFEKYMPDNSKKYFCPLFIILQFLKQIACV